MLMNLCLEVTVPSILPLSQYFPAFPRGQSHSYPIAKGTHVAPELQLCLIKSHGLKLRAHVGPNRPSGHKHLK